MRATSLCMCVRVCVWKVCRMISYFLTYTISVSSCVYGAENKRMGLQKYTHTQKKTELIRSFFVSSRARISLGCGRHWSWSLAGAVGGRRVNANLPQRWWRTHIIASRGEAQAERVRDRIQNVRAVCAKFRRRSGDVRFFLSPTCERGESGRE